ncbi:MAG: chorismate--pyruvate lyase family protein [Pseudomonadota bacterium]
MISCKSDYYWNTIALGCDAEMRPWLHDCGSLTQRIQQRCRNFAVQPVSSGLSGITFDESAVLGIRAHQLAYVREVFLYADGRPVVFAHSVCAPQHLRGVWRALGGLGNRPLGAMLFSHPLVQRQPLHYKALHARHPLYQLVARALTNPPQLLWARRSVFHLRGAPLMVTEAYLPQILTLDNL